MKSPIYTRVVAVNGMVNEDEALEQFLNDMSDAGHTLVSHQATMGDPNLLIEVVIMAKEDKA